VPRYSRQPFTERDVWVDGAPFRIMELAAIVGWSKPRLMRAVEAGELNVIKRNVRGSTVMVQRSEARRWLLALGWQRESVERGTTLATPATRNLNQ
jgi:hypothetical protein